MVREIIWVFSREISLREAVWGLMESVCARLWDETDTALESPPKRAIAFRHIRSSGAIILYHFWNACHIWVIISPYMVWAYPVSPHV